MDFDDFDDGLGNDPQLIRNAKAGADEALKMFDRTWYIPRSRASRRMDLLGDYAGNEYFLIDGEAIFQEVLDDPLLALGREDEPTFQILHAYHTLERIVGEYTTRPANFEIVFFDDTRHLTLRTGDDPYIVASRMLARTMLFKHLSKLGVVVHNFKTLASDRWKAFEKVKKPMFILTNDGGAPDPDLPTSASRVLSQRKFVYDVLQGTIAIALLRGAAYADSKITTFVYGPVRQGGKRVFPERFLRSLQGVRAQLNGKLKRLQRGVGPAASVAKPMGMDRFRRGTGNWSNDSDEDSDGDSDANSGDDVPEQGGDVLCFNGTGDQFNADKSNLEDRDSFILEVTDSIVSASNKTGSDKNPTPNRTLAFLSILHYYHLPTLSIQARAHSPIKLKGALSKSLCVDFLTPLFLTVTSLLASPKYRHVDYDFDGTIFVVTAAYASQNVRALMISVKDMVGEEVYAQVQGIWSHVNGGNEPSMASRLLALAAWLGRPTLPGHIQGSSAGQGIHPVVASPPIQLLPFDNPVFNKHLPAVTRSDQPSSPSTTYMHFGAGEGTMFSDTRHWHNQKSILPPHLGGEKVQVQAKPPPNSTWGTTGLIKGKYTLREWIEMKRLKRHQQFMSNLQIQAATITGAAGGVLRQMVIPAVGGGGGGGRRSPVVGRSGSEKVIAAAPHARGGGGKKKGKPAKLTSKQLLLQKIQDEKSNSANDASRAWWKERLASLSESSLETQVQELANLFRNPRAEEESTRLEMELYELNLEVMRWAQEAKPEEEEVKDRYMLAIMRIIKRMVDKKALTATSKEVITTLLTLFGFERYIDGLLNDVRLVDGSASFKFKKLVKTKGGERVPVHGFMVGKEDPVEWQLRLFGEYMDRSMDSAYDRRVEFQPDAWQRKVLDCIDDNHSVLVVAPTSAGKTFISFYAMEKVLRASDDDILVYVAPTKALVTQIAAEIYARFSKKMDGRSCWAIHTRDYRINDPQKCQILVTVPEVLAIMLLSPPLATVWTPRIKHIILDEIHSIGHQEGGAVWEQILLLAPCPIIGLSATIGSPEIFNDWLAKVQEAHGFKHTFVRHPHRYSHLRKFFYVLKDGEEEREFVSLSQHKATGRTRFIHPISALSFGRATIPDDLALEAKDTLTLYRALTEVASRRGLRSDALSRLDPKTFFAGQKIMLRQRDVLEYEAQLKEVIAALLEGAGPFEGLTSSEASTVGLEVVAELQDPVLKRNSSGLDVTPNKRTFRSNLIHLVADLHVQGELPAILFNFDRTGCEYIGRSLGDYLEAAEERYKETSPAWKRKLEQWEVWKLGAKERAARLEKQKKRKGKDDDAEHANAQETATWTWEQSFDPDGVLPDFSFANYRSSYAASELDEDIGKLSWGDSVPKWAFALLRRGIGVHHAGMNKGYRSLVEALFRRGFLRVVVATGTLALGINAPAKTTVFCADSPYLTALEYRQCAGRAGRRGYDLLGNVIFYGLPMDRVQRLMLSRLPVLGGGFPLTSTLVLRLCNLLEESNRAPNVVKAINTILSMPRVSFASDVGHDYLVHHVQFSIEYLRRNGLLNEEGKPMNLFAIAGHLYYAEPSNLALVGLLRAGALHSICKGIPAGASNSDVKIDEAKKNYILLMAHLFGRRVLPSSLAENEEELRRLTSKYPSRIVLPPMPECARNALQEQADDILDVFVGYARAFAATKPLADAENPRLPLSGAYPSSATAGRQGGTLTTFLRDTSNATTVRSAFVANSGLKDDNFKTVQELAHTVRTGIHLNAHAIPCLDPILSSSVPPSKGEAPKASSGSTKTTAAKLNAYLFDYYIHGQKDTIVNANGIRRNDMWYLLEDFRLVLMTVKSALEQLLLKASAANVSSRAQGRTTRTVLRSNWRKKTQPLVVGTGEWDDTSEEESEEETMLGSDTIASPDETLVGFDEDIDDGEDIDDEDEGVKTNFKRPAGVTNQDWTVYRVVSLACAEFDEKARAMWA